ncbi:MAG: FeoB-associated Cys-rich membrane protein [Oscillibacter sp.]|nr:FeoB-associated Cys-rich membrane protein [Oscillibacter sp.]
MLGNAVALLLVVLLAAACVRNLWRDAKRGGCGGCAGCSGHCAGCARKGNPS